MLPEETASPSAVPASDKWPDDVVLYQPYQVEQITLPEYAQCLAVEAFLRMSGLIFRVEQRKNAADMSPTGKVPFIRSGNQLIAEFDPIVAFAASRGFSLSKHLPEPVVAEMRAYVAMLENTLSNAEHFLAWLVPDVLSEVTAPRYGCAYPWPLNWILPRLKQREVVKLMRVKDWATKSVEEVKAEVDTCFKALSDKIAKGQFFLGGSQPTELDAVVFGHLFSLQTAKLPGSPLGANACLEDFPNLAEFCKRIEAAYFF